ncbi:MAG: response regulator, partial [Chloroflexota bacterium]
RSVLVVDDNADSQHLFTRYLEARGYHVLTAGNGEEALRITLHEHPDAILLDVMLPSSDGYEVLQALASEPSIGRVPIVVCTVLKQRDLALALGATEFLAKPVTQGELLGTLDRCLARSDSMRRY